MAAEAVAMANPTAPLTLAATTTSSELAALWVSSGYNWRNVRTTATVAVDCVAVTAVAVVVVVARQRADAPETR